MNENKLMDALSEIKEEYVMEAAPKNKKKAKKPYTRWIAAALVVIVAVGFSFTSPGTAALGRVKGLIESLFPPKDVVVNIEGESEIHTNEADGKEPETKADGTDVPGFAIYYDKEMYEMVKEGDVTYIRFITDDDDDLPIREMKIEHVSDSQPNDTAKTERESLLSKWKNVSEISKTDSPEGFCVSFSDGDEWDSICGDVYFLSDDNGGCFKITARYFVEAAEGHGSRFAQMLQSFEIIDSQS